ncbi:MAG TPA: glycosyltransferase family 4 protein [Planctomycetaceae bacterium]|nr:glycosyltransferase family 4 protein [Planctomycetaceae bacterium]
MTRPWLIVTGDFSRTGGMDRANLALAERLAERDIPVHLVCHAADERLVEHPLVTLHQVARPAGMHFPASFLLSRTARAVAGRFRDAVVVANGGNLSWAGLNWIHYLHAAWDGPVQGLGLRSWKQRIERRIERRREAQAISQAQVVICNSRLTAEQAGDRLNIPEDRLHVIYYGADAERFPLVTPAERQRMRSQLGMQPDQLCLAFVGALGDRRKNFDTLFEAWRRLHTEPEWRDAVLLVIGHGAQLPQWRQRAGDCGLGESIRFLGFRCDVHDVLAACDLLVHPARYEAFGLSPYEALCRGLPVLVSATAGVAEVIPDHLSPLLLQSPDDTDELMTRLRGWRERREQFAEAVVALSDHCRSRSWNDMADEIIAAGHGTCSSAVTSLPVASV